MKTKRYESMAGNHISVACKEAAELARRDSCNVEFDFNEITLTAKPDSDPAALAKFYSDECDRRHEAYIASPEYKAREAAYELKERGRKSKVAEVLADAPEHMTLRDADGWKKACDANQDGYGGAVMTYSERWARLMEARMAKGESMEDMADECSHLADDEGITGFMYGCAVSTLAAVWIHGEALRRWHNVKHQISHEGERANETGGVLNPALLSIGKNLSP